MRRLHIDQPVSLSLDEVHDVIACRVLEVQGSVSRLSCEEELAPRVIGLLALGSAGYLVFQQYGIGVGLRVAVRASPPYLDAAVIDGVALPERRESERLKLVTRARVLAGDGGDGDDEGDWTETINLSGNGALLRQHPRLAGRGRFGLELVFGDDPHPVTVEARVVRRLRHAVGVVFESIAAEDEARLAEYLNGIRQHRRAALRN